MEDWQLLSSSSENPTVLNMIFLVGASLIIFQCKLPNDTFTVPRL